MPILNYSLSSNKGGLPISSEELVSRYFFGIPLVDQSGNSMSADQLNFYINSAMQSIEGFLNLKLSKQVIEETLDYYVNDYHQWGYIPTTYPVLTPGKLVGFLGKTQQIEFPVSWLVVKESNTGDLAHRQINIVPTAGTAEFSDVVYSGISPHVGWFGAQTIPRYWTAQYTTSFKQVPADILDAVGKLAAINIFNQLGDIILGAGIASQSIGIDGLSQSISTTSSATNAGYGARITQYLKELKEARTDLKNKYVGISMTVA